MDFDRICVWVTVIACLVLLARLARNRFAGSSDWAAICVLVLALDGVGYVLVPALAGRIAGTVWLFLLVAPSWLNQLSARRIVQRRYAAARRYAKLTWFLHPFDGQWAVPIVIRALGLAHQGDTDQALAVLSRLKADPKVSSGMRAAIAAHKARLAHDWAAIPTLAAGGRNSASLASVSMRLRALGETGHLRDLVTEFRAAPRSTGMEYQLRLLFLFAFCGRHDAVADVLHGPLAELDADTKTFWLATADLAGGRSDGRVALAALAARDGPTRDAARQRLEHAPAKSSDTLGPAERQFVDETIAEMRRDADYRDVAHGQWRNCPVIIVLVVLNVAVFAVEVYRGGSESARVLYEMGGLWVDAVVKGGEWWRLVTALFVHAGPVHLGFNMLALVVIGSRVEWMAGHWRLLLVYLASGIGSMAAVLVLILFGLMRDGLLVGASGAIFGVVGAEVVLLAQGWRRLGSSLAARRLLALGLLVALQVVFDLTTPQVSFAAHASGFAIGICLMALLLVVPRGGAKV